MSFGLKPEEQVAILQQKRARDAFEILTLVQSYKARGATCDEVLVALDLPHQTGSPRFQELAKAGCLVATDKRRRTRSGKTAVVHVVAKDASFIAYLTLGSARGKKTKAAGLSTRERAILDASLEFLSRWNAAKTSKGREKPLATLIQRLCVADKLTS